MIAAHYAPVRDLLALGDDRPAPHPDLDADTVGGYLPGTDIWLGLDRSLYGPSNLSWRKRVDLHKAETSAVEGVGLGSTVSVGRDGHVLQLGPAMSRVYEAWQEGDGEGEEPSESPS